MNELWDSVFANLVSEVLVVAAGVIFTYGIWRGYVAWRYGRWRVLVKQGEQTLVQRAISARKAKEIQEEPADLAVFLKGVTSPYAWITCDLIEEGEKLGLLAIDRQQRCYIVDIAKNPPPRAAAPGGQMG